MSIFSGEELQHINVLKQRISEWARGAGGNTHEDHEAAELAKGYIDDSTIWRYCLANDFDDEESYTMFVNSMRWRVAERIDDLFAEWEAGTSKRAQLGKLCKGTLLKMSFKDEVAKKTTHLPTDHESGPRTFAPDHKRGPRTFDQVAKRGHALLDQFTRAAHFDTKSQKGATHFLTRSQKGATHLCTK